MHKLLTSTAVTFFLVGMMIPLANASPYFFNSEQSKREGEAPDLPQLGRDGGGDASPYFLDVEDSNRYHTSINHFYEKGVIQGYGDQNFGPYDELNRAEAVKMILMTFGEIPENEIESEIQASFQDVSVESWYYPWIQKAYEKGLIQGYPDGNFHPEKSVNLAELLKMVLSLASPNNGFFTQTLSNAPSNDTFAEEWYAPYIQYALNKSLIYRDTEKNIHPAKNRTRGELTDILYRWENPNVYSGILEFGKATFYGEAVAGWGTASGETFDPSLFTAAHKTLPFGTIVRVTNLRNQKTVEVKINDRGPWGEGRIIDLSSGAFASIASLGAGVIDVEIETVYSLP